MVVNSDLSPEEQVVNPAVSPPYTLGKAKFLNRANLTVVYRSDPDIIRRLVPEPLRVESDEVTLAFLWMDAPGLGQYSEIAQSVAASFEGEALQFRPQMYADNIHAILGGREVTGLPKSYANPKLRNYGNTLIGSVDYYGERIATATIGYKYAEADIEAARADTLADSVVLKTIPHIDGTPRIKELIKISYSDDSVVKEAYTGPVILEQRDNAICKLNVLPVGEIVRGVYTVTDTSFKPSVVLYDYLA